MEELNNRLISLYHAFVSNTATADETAEFFELLKHMDIEDALKAEIYDSFDQENAGIKTGKVNWQASLDRILHTDEIRVSQPVIRSGWRRYAVAAAIVSVLSLLGYYWSDTNDSPATQLVQKNKAEPKTDLKPGRNGAFLVLGDGTIINLDSAGNGVLAFQGKTKVLNQNGSVSYEKTGLSQKEPLYNTIQTPRGRQYSLILSDGSKVWLNAASSIRYPTFFTAEERRVEITGEVYFEIAAGFRKSKTGLQEKIPFVVKFNTVSGKPGAIQVMGTHFNVNTYGDDKEIKATLLEGSIRMDVDHQQVLLAPGQQLTMDKKGQLNLLEDVNVDAEMAWKDGYFSFKGTGMYTLMNEIGRWYDVDVEYAGRIPDRKFGGEISRSSNASQVLKIMEESDVRFKIEEKKIIVLP